MTQIIVIVILTLINAFFAAAEMAMVSVNRTRLTMLIEQGNKRAVILEGLIDETSRLLATIQVGITLAGFFSSAFAATGLSQGLGQALGAMGVPYSQQVAIVLITVLISFVMLLFGELFPKRLALIQPERIALASARPVQIVSGITKPFVMLLSGCTNLLLRMFGVHHENLEQRVSEEEIRSMVKVGQEYGVINQTEKQMINAIFEFDDKLAREVMTPAVDVKMVDLAQPVEKILDQLIQLKFSRIPVFKRYKDQLAGVVHLKDLLAAVREKGFENISVGTIARPVYFVPETMAIDRLFVKLQRDREHMAVLIDEHGMMTGIVTMEDLIEEVMGNIEDEFDDEAKAIKLTEMGYTVDGGLSIYDFNEFFHTEIDNDKADTIGGHLVAVSGQMPEEMMGQSVAQGSLTLEVTKVEDRRIRQILVKGFSSESME